jgi:hypothetical protein
MQIERLAQCSKELRLDAADGDPLAVRGRVTVVERCTPARQAAPVRGIWRAATPPRLGDRKHREHTLEHRDVHVRAAPGLLATVHCREHRERSDETTGGEVGHDVERDRRLLTVTGGDRKEPCPCEIIDVVAGLRRERAALAVAGERAVDEAPVALGHRRVSQAQPIHHSRAKPLDEDVGTVDELRRDSQAVLVLEVDDDRAPGTVERIDLQAPRLAAAVQRDLGDGRAIAPGGGGLDRDHIGPDIAEQHRRERPWCKRAEVDDSEPAERCLLNHRRRA